MSFAGINFFILIFIIISVTGCSSASQGENNEPDIQSFIISASAENKEIILFPEEWEPGDENWERTRRDPGARDKLPTVSITDKTKVIDTRPGQDEEVPYYKLGTGQKVAVRVAPGTKRADRIEILEYTRQDYLDRMVSRQEDWYSVYAFISVDEEMSPQEEAGYDKLFSHVHDYKYSFRNIPLGRSSDNEKKYAEYFNITDFPMYLVLDNEGIVLRTQGAEEVFEFFKNNETQ